VAHCLSSFLLLCIMCLYVLGSVTISAYRRCSVGLYLQLFFGGRGDEGRSCLMYVICVCLPIVVSKAYCVVFIFV